MSALRIAHRVGRTFAEVVGKKCRVVRFGEGYGVTVSGLWLADVDAAGIVTHRATDRELADVVALHARQRAAGMTGIGLLQVEAAPVASVAA